MLPLIMAALQLASGQQQKNNQETGAVQPALPSSGFQVAAPQIQPNTSLGGAMGASNMLGALGGAGGGSSMANWQNTGNDIFNNQKVGNSGFGTALGGK